MGQGELQILRGSTARDMWKSKWKEFNTEMGVNQYLSLRQSVCTLVVGVGGLSIEASGFGGHTPRRGLGLIAVKIL